MCVELEKRSQSKSKSVEQERVQAATGQRHKSKVRVLSARAFRYVLSMESFSWVSSSRPKAVLRARCAGVAVECAVPPRGNVISRGIGSKVEVGDGVPWK